MSPIKSINFSFPQSDELILYVPKNGGGFKQYRTGLLIFDQPLSEFYEASNIFIKTSDIDFTRPFYVKNIPMTFFGRSSINSSFSLIAHSNIPAFYQNEYKDATRSYETFEFIFAMLIGMIVISFVFMMIHFIIIRKFIFCITVFICFV